MTKAADVAADSRAGLGSHATAAGASGWTGGVGGGSARRSFQRCELHGDPTRPTACGGCPPSPQGGGIRARFLVATPAFASGHCLERWEAGHGAEPLKLYYVAGLPCPAGLLALPGGDAESFHRATSVRARSSGLITQPRYRLRSRTGAVPATLARFATRVPVQEMTEVSLSRERRECSCEYFFVEGVTHIATVGGIPYVSNGLGGVTPKQQNCQLRKRTKSIHANAGMTPQLPSQRRPLQGRPRQGRRV